MNPVAVDDARLMLLDGVTSASWPGVLTALVVAFSLGLGVSLLHRLSLRPRAVSPSLAASFALLPVVTCLVLVVIGDSLARSFALVGALAIVRFRTRLRSTWDITYVFLALGVGIACGVGRLDIALAGGLVAALATAVLTSLPGTREEGPLHAVRCDVAAWQCGDSQLAAVMDGLVQTRRLVSTRSQRFGEALTLTYHVLLQENGRIDELVRALAEVEGVERVEALGAAEAEAA